MTNKAREIIGGYRTLADRLDELGEDLKEPQFVALRALLEQAWSTIERRTSQRRANV